MRIGLNERRQPVLKSQVDGVQSLSCFTIGKVTFFYRKQSPFLVGKSSINHLWMIFIVAIHVYPFLRMWTAAQPIQNCMNQRSYSPEGSTGMLPQHLTLATPNNFGLHGGVVYAGAYADFCTGPLVVRHDVSIVSPFNAHHKNRLNP